MTMMALPDLQTGMQIQSIEIYFAGAPTTLYLNDEGFQGDFVAGDGLFGLVFPLGGPLPSGRFPLELKVVNGNSEPCKLWPYLNVAP